MTATTSDALDAREASPTRASSSRSTSPTRCARWRSPIASIRATAALKVGKELFVAAGPEPVRWMVERGFNVFLDLKFHDIPNTVAQACAAATRLGVWMLNVHAAGGERDARGRARRRRPHGGAAGGTPPLLIARHRADEPRRRRPRARSASTDGAATHALRLARLARDCGLDGVVCSAQ